MLVEKVRRTVEEHKLIDNKQHIVMGLSGGPDSVCLFHILIRLSKEYNLTIHPVHVNHKFRPGAAERDQAYVEELCMKYGLECRTFVVDCNTLAQELHMTSEEAGRKARYDAFYQVAQEVSGGDFDSVKIAVAQNANDQAETILFRLLRGTGTDGLAGIAYERKERGISVIRPILDIYRNEIEEYCAKNDLDPVIDHTNNEEIYARNKIRLDLLPYLEEKYNENMKASLVRLGRIASQDKDYIWQQVEKEYNRIAEETTERVIMNREALSRMHLAIRHRVMLKAFERIGLDKDVSEERLKAADQIIDKKQAPKTVQFPRGYKLVVAKGQVIFEK
jgi:tRNA(Ile)-lysidine synthase